jgi:hypothetical protein
MAPALLQVERFEQARCRTLPQAFLGDVRWKAGPLAKGDPKRKMIGGRKAPWKVGSRAGITAALG